MKGFLAGSTLIVLATAATAQPTHQLPTATELFNLRGRCAELGEMMMAENVVGSALTQSQVSRYDPRSGRCFVELTTQNVDWSKPLYLSRTLFDGQTKELLAASGVRGPDRWGSIFDRGYKGFELLPDAGFSSTNEYIDRIMSQ